MAETEVQKASTVFDGIAERWGFPEPTPPREEWRNGNRPL